MVRNRNGYWMSPKFYMSASAEGGDGGAGGADPAGAGQNDGAGGEPGAEETNEDHSGEDVKALQATIEQLKRDMAEQKTALDKATKEAADRKRELRAKQTQEEIDAETKKEAEEKTAKELEELRKKVAKAESTKSVMAKLSVDEETAGQIAESLVGCENIENALLLIQKTWTAKEKALRLEFGKIPGPGTGGGSEDKEMQEAIALAKELGQRRAQGASSVRDQLKGLVR